MRRPGFSFFHSVIGVLMALVLLGAAGLDPAGAVPVREQAPLGPQRTVSLPLTVPQTEHTATAPFTDVPTGHVFYEEIAWLAETGVSTGWPGPDGTRQFRPYQPTLRDQMAAFHYRLDPLLPGQDTPTVEVVSGYDSAYAIRADGTVWAWGRNSVRQLGNGTTTDTSVPVRVAGLSDVQSLEIDGYSAHALTEDGTVWAWGSNHVGQLGNGTTTASSVPVQVTGLAGVQSIEANNASSAYAVTTDGTVWAWGNNRYGELGNGTTTDSALPVRVTGLSDVESIDSINHSAYTLTTEGTVGAWGRNHAGQLGDGTRTDSSVPVPVSRLNG